MTSSTFDDPHQIKIYRFYFGLKTCYRRVKHDKLDIQLGFIPKKQEYEISLSNYFLIIARRKLLSSSECFDEIEAFNSMTFDK